MQPASAWSLGAVLPTAFLPARLRRFISRLDALAVLLRLRVDGACHCGQLFVDAAAVVIVARRFRHLVVWMFLTPFIHFAFSVAAAASAASVASTSFATSSEINRSL